MDTQLVPREPWKRVLITGFVLFTAAAVACSSLRPLPDRNPVGRALLIYANALRIFQRWELFVPEPRRMATEYRVDIEFAKGAGVWRRTAPAKWDFFQRHEAYNFQKWDLAGHHLDVPGQLWTDLAHYIMKRYDTDPANPMVSLQLVRSMADWPPPRESGWVGGDAADLKWKDQVLFTYYVKEGKIFY